jgi:predicted peptidase
VAVEFDQEIDDASVFTQGFRVKGRSITNAYVNTSALLSTGSRNGRFVILALSPDDAGAALYTAQGHGVVRKEAKATVTQVGPVSQANEQVMAAHNLAITTSKVVNMVVDDFRQLEFIDPKTGERLRYNLFTPAGYDPKQRYPLVLFMHDAGATSKVTTTTLVQGLGAIAWANPEDQARRPAFVLAPQYDAPVVNDQSEATSQLDTTVRLVQQLASQYSIDSNRLYATGQSGGAMMSIAMNIKYPDLFAASFLVAGQWDAAKVRPMVHSKLWIMVSQGDLKAYPGQNAITAELEKAGAKVSRAVWSGRTSPDLLSAKARAMNAEGSAINYVALQAGTVVPRGQRDDGGANHVNTWRIAYNIEGIRDWMFQQRRTQALP